MFYNLYIKSNQYTVLSEWRWSKVWVGVAYLSDAVSAAGSQDSSFGTKYQSVANRAVSKMTENRIDSQISSSTAEHSTIEKTDRLIID